MPASPLLTQDTLTLGDIQERLGLSQSATSEQVPKLKDAGLLIGAQVETSMHYRLNKELLIGMGDFSRTFWQEIEGRLP